MSTARTAHTHHFHVAKGHASWGVAYPFRVAVRHAPLIGIRFGFHSRSRTHRCVLLPIALRSVRVHALKWLYPCTYNVMLIADVSLHCSPCACSFFPLSLAAWSAWKCEHDLVRDLFVFLCFFCDFSMRWPAVRHVCVELSYIGWRQRRRLFVMRIRIRNIITVHTMWHATATLCVAWCAGPVYRRLSPPDDRLSRTPPTRRRRRKRGWPQHHTHL